MSDCTIQAEYDNEKDLVYLKSDDRTYITAIHPDSFHDLFPGWTRDLEKYGEVEIPYQGEPPRLMRVRGVGAE